MEKKINYLSLCYTMFLILLVLSGSLAGILSELVYISAFILPFVIIFILDKQSLNDNLNLISISKRSVRLTLPLIAPTVGIVIIISAITAFLISVLIGVKNQVDVGDLLIPALISHALIPAVLEEALFRYLPMKILGESKRLTVIASALFFAFAHHSLFSIPYAFAAGIIFMTLDLMAGSIIPSLIIHFINNAISVGMLVYADNVAFTPAIIIILAILSAISIVFIIRNRPVYQKELKKIFKKDVNVLYTLPLKIFTILSLFAALIALM